MCTPFLSLPFLSLSTVPNTRPDQEAGGSEVQEDPGHLWGTQLEWLSGDAAGGDIGVRAW